MEESTHGPEIMAVNEPIKNLRGRDSRQLGVRATSIRKCTRIRIYAIGGCGWVIGVGNLPRAVFALPELWARIQIAVG